MAKIAHFFFSVHRFCAKKGIFLLLKRLFMTKNMTRVKKAIDVLGGDVDAIGISAAGVIVENKPMVSSIFIKSLIFICGFMCYNSFIKI